MPSINTAPVLKPAIAVKIYEEKLAGNAPKDKNAPLDFNHEPTLWFASLCKFVFTTKTANITIKDFARIIYRAKNEELIYYSRIIFEVLTSEQISSLIACLIDLEYEMVKENYDAFMRGNNITITLLEEQGKREPESVEAQTTYIKPQVDALIELKNKKNINPQNIYDLMFAYLASIVKLFDNVPSMISKNFAAIYKICENNAALQPATPSMIGGYFFLRYLMYYLRTQPIEIQALYRSTLQTPLQKMSNQLRLEKPEEFNAEKSQASDVKSFNATEDSINDNNAATSDNSAEADQNKIHLLCASFSATIATKLVNAAKQATIIEMPSLAEKKLDSQILSSMGGKFGEIRIYIEHKITYQARLMKDEDMTNNVIHLIDNDSLVSKEISRMQELFADNRLLFPHTHYLNACGDNGCTPLITACMGGFFATAKVLLENGAKLDAKSLSGETTFNTAIAAGHTKLFMMLIDESNRTALETADLEGKTPLLAAAAAGNLDAIKHVVKQNVNMAAVSSQKETALHLTVRSGNGDCVSYLIDKVKIDEVNMRGETALIIATQKQLGPIVAQLLQHGADTQIKDTTGRTALDYIANNPNLIQLFSKSASSYSRFRGTMEKKRSFKRTDSTTLLSNIIDKFVDVLKTSLDEKKYEAAIKQQAEKSTAPLVIQALQQLLETEEAHLKKITAKDILKRISTFLAKASDVFNLYNKDIAIQAKEFNAAYEIYFLLITPKTDKSLSAQEIDTIYQNILLTTAAMPTVKNKSIEIFKNLCTHKPSVAAIVLGKIFEITARFDNLAPNLVLPYTNIISQHKNGNIVMTAVQTYYERYLEQFSQHRDFQALTVAYQLNPERLIAHFQPAANNDNNSQAKPALPPRLIITASHYANWPQTRQLWQPQFTSLMAAYQSKKSSDELSAAFLLDPVATIKQTKTTDIKNCLLRSIEVVRKYDEWEQIASASKSLAKEFLDNFTTSSQFDQIQAAFLINSDEAIEYCLKLKQKNSDQFDKISKNLTDLIQKYVASGQQSQLLTKLGLEEQNFVFM